MKYLCILLIRFYRKFLSPLKRTSTCRFVPSCSAYALEAYTKRGFFVGSYLTVYRILRCNPFCPGGYDPVPARGTPPFQKRAARRNEKKIDSDASSAQTDGTAYDAAKVGAEPKLICLDYVTHSDRRQPIRRRDEE